MCLSYKWEDMGKGGTCMEKRAGRGEGGMCGKHHPFVDERCLLGGGASVCVRAGLMGRRRVRLAGDGLREEELRLQAGPPTPPRAPH